MNAFRHGARREGRALMSLVALAAALQCGCSREVDLLLFEEATQSAGLDGYSGMTHGAAWGDYDADGLPDLYVTNHLREPMLFRNLGQGRFADATAQAFSPEEIRGDKHGAAWADFDNDGRLDLAQLNGAVRGMGAEPKRLYHNDGAHLADVAAAVGVQNPEGRTRMPLWVDVNHDGRLDLFEGADARLDDKTPPFLFMQHENGFVPDASLPLAVRGTPFCMLAELTNDDSADMLCRVAGKDRTSQVFDLSAQPVQDLALLPPTAFEDAAIADFDNDGRMDVFLTRKNPPGAVAFGQVSTAGLVADISLDATHAGQPAGFRLRSPGPLTVEVASPSPPDAVTAERIHLGERGAHPAAMRFVLASDMPDIRGTPTSTPGAAAGLYVGFSPPDRWEFHVTAPKDAHAGGKPAEQQVQVRIAAGAPLSDLESIGDPPAAEEAPARLFMNHDGRFVEEGESRGVNRRLVAGMNVVAADFDNDMDVDLYVVASGDIGRQPNLLLLNDGKGHFDVVKHAGGAAGSPAGVGDSVSSADVDGDGFLDLFLANGGSMGRSLGLPSDAGNYQLFRNVGNGNHWLMIDLEGTRSNRDGIGALVRVSAGGVTQTRLQDGGVHHRSQNHARLHFGLGTNTRADTITLHWPSGATQQLHDVRADQVLHIRETE